MGEVIQMVHPLEKENAMLRFLLRDTVDLLTVLDYANEESEMAAEVQTEVVTAVLTGAEIPV